MQWKNFSKLLSIVRTSRFLKREKNPFTSYVVVLHPRYIERLLNVYFLITFLDQTNNFSLLKHYLFTLPNPINASISWISSWKTIIIFLSCMVQLHKLLNSAKPWHVNFCWFLCFVPNLPELNLKLFRSDFQNNFRFSSGKFVAKHRNHQTITCQVLAELNKIWSCLIFIKLYDFPTTGGLLHRLFFETLEKQLRKRRSDLVLNGHMRATKMNPVI